MRTDNAQPDPFDVLAATMKAVHAEIARAIEAERQLQVLGFAMASVLKGHDLCAAVALGTLPIETVRALIDCAPQLRAAAAEALAARS